jgi:hypothetical protein
MTDNNVLQSIKPKRRPPAAGMGRIKGSLNKKTVEMREFWQNLIQGQQAKIDEKLTELADTDAGKYLSIILQAQEFFAPRLNRSEITGANGGAVQLQEISINLVAPCKISQ